MGATTAHPGVHAQEYRACVVRIHALGLGALEVERMIIRRFIVTVATEDSVTQKNVEDAFEHGLDMIPGANENRIAMESEWKSDVDRGVDPMGTVEDNDRWSRLAEKELRYGPGSPQDSRAR
jgi:hypothetical protein